MISTHLAEDVDALADQVVALRDGSVAFQGSLSDLQHRASDDAQGATVTERGLWNVLEAS